VHVEVRSDRVVWAVSALALALAAAVACDVPEAPEWEVGLAVPFTSDPIAIVDFLPAEVRVDTIGGQPVFAVDPQRDSVDYVLAELCPSCAVLAGLTVPVPAFEFVDSLDVVFPAELVSVEVTRARLGMRVRNALNFDPLRPHPNPDSAGFVVLVARDLATGAVLDSVSFSGASTTWPSGSTLESVFDVSSVQITDGVRVFFHVYSPADTQTVTIDPNMSVRLGGFMEQIQVGAVTALVDSLTLDERMLADVSQSARSELADRVQSGSYELTLMHDMEVDGTIEISVAGSPLDLFSGDPAREVVIGPFVLAPNVAQTGELTAAEIELIAAFPEVYIGYRAVAWGTRTMPPARTNLSRFTPDQTLKARLELVSRVRVGR
jgi:hypothetical protein